MDPVWSVLSAIALLVIGALVLIPVVGIGLALVDWMIEKALDLEKERRP